MDSQQDAIQEDATFRATCSSSSGCNNYGGNTRDGSGKTVNKAGSSTNVNVNRRRHCKSW